MHTPCSRHPCRPLQSHTVSCFLSQLSCLSHSSPNLSHVPFSETSWGQRLEETIPSTLPSHPIVPPLTPSPEYRGDKYLKVALGQAVSAALFINLWLCRLEHQCPKETLTQHPPISLKAAAGAHSVAGLQYGGTKQDTG